MLLILYIRRIKRKQQQTLQAYLELLEDNKGSTPEEAENTKKNEADTNAPEMPADPFVQHVLDFVEKNMANGDADVSQMAEACAVSRSVLQRKMKQLVGLTPSDFMREARLKHACNLLRNTSLTVAEVAYRSGFNDPKYFSRSFKQSLGMSPSDYKAQKQ